MVVKDQEFLRRLLATFRVEAQDHLRNITSGLLELEHSETASEQEAGIESIFREAHSLKGAARSVNLDDIEKICQKLESVFRALQGKVVGLSPELFDILHHTVGTLEHHLKVDQDSPPHGKITPTKELLHSLDNAVNGDSQPGGQAEESAQEQPLPRLAPAEETVEAGPDRASTRISSTTETVRISSDKLQAVLLQTEEMLSAKAMATQRARDMEEISSTFDSWKKEWGKALPIVRNLKSEKTRFLPLGQLEKRRDDRKRTELNDFLEMNRIFIKSLEERINFEARRAKRDAHSLDDMINNLLEDMKHVMMVPFSSFLEILPKYVRELSRDQKKEVSLNIEGGELEVDRRILEEMKDPLIHLIRNCIDHGIEKPAVRQQKGKPPLGTITITISPKNGNKVEIRVADDGAGVDLDKVKAAAHFSDNGEKLSEEDLLDSLFRSGVSTSPIITEISGRGLGLAIVREKVEKVNGSVVLESSPATGTLFRIELPMTIATFRGVQVRVGEQIYILPTNHVDRVLRVKKSVIKTVENRETIELDGQAVSLAVLGNVLGVAPAQPSTSKTTIQTVVLNSPGQKIAFVVDEVINEQEVLLKNLGRQIARVRNIAGATVLGSGRVVPVLNVADLKKSAVTTTYSGTLPTLVENGDERKKKTTLVVEDSITSRTLLKNILESAGYRVVVAIDGVDALSKIRNEEFDIVVSDVEMPRMNGFELTAQIRADAKLAELPVVIVTSLESKNDRERGIEVGANAYIVKSSFDHSNLLDIMERLL